jgi:hypothetical protein
LKAPGIKSDKQSADAILDTSLTSQAYISTLEPYSDILVFQAFAFKCASCRYVTLAQKKALEENEVRVAEEYDHMLEKEERKVGLYKLSVVAPD